MKWFFCACAALFFLPVASQAFAEPQFNSKTLSVNGIRLGAGFDAAKKIGQAEPFYEGDASVSAKKLCFAFPQGGLMLFESNDTNGAIDNIRVDNPSFQETFLDPVERLESQEKCGKTYLSISDVVLPFGIKMGASYEQIIQILGTPEAESKGGNIRLVEFAQHRDLPANAYPEKWDMKACGAPALFHGINVYIDENNKVIGVTLWTGGPYC